MKPYPLTRSNRLRLARAFATVPDVDISIDCVLEDQMGVAFVDSVDSPSAYMIEQDQFFCYLAGDLTSDAGREFIAQIPNGRFLMAGSPGWETVVQQTLGERADAIPRYTYASDTLSLDHLKRLAADTVQTGNVQRIDSTLIQREIPFFEIGAFESADDFLDRGIGYCALEGEVITGVAYSSLVCSNAIEISIVVHPDHRRKGVATAVACQLLIWCLERHITSHWDAANPESCKLAEKLGYRKVGDYTAYFVHEAKG